MSEIKLKKKLVKFVIDKTDKIDYIDKIYKIGKTV